MADDVIADAGAETAVDDALASAPDAGQPNDAAPSAPPQAPAEPQDALSGADGLGAAQAKPADAAAEPPGHDYSGLALSKDSPLDKAALGSMREFAAEQGMTPETAQQFLTYQEQLKKAYDDEFHTAASVALKETMADAELGGESWPTTQRDMVKGLQHFDPIVTQYLRQTKLINQKAVVAGLARIGRMSREPGKPAPTGNDAAAPSSVQGKLADYQTKYPGSWRDMARADGLGEYLPPEKATT